ncbi:MAG: 50S ribosome-binding GTPase [Planctomycetota bacterium]|nr:50S ribosome-binding GTPase [Planctomycetota bacterium]
MSTIAAISSPPGPGLRGVLRVSGPLAAELVRRTVAPDVPMEPFPPAERAALHGEFRDARGAQPVLLFWMPGPRSSTREDVAELHLPGSPPLLEAALERLLQLGARAAAPGELTRRAFLNGRIDLTRAEGVLQLVEATNESERRAALSLLTGGLAERVEALRDGLEDLRALCEASLDFDAADTGHVPVDELLERARAIETDLERALVWEVRRQSHSALPRIVLFGLPNVGKSSLFNALIPAGRAIVSDLAGTTRDGAAGTWTVAGVECLLLDAPGVDRAATGADAIAQELAAREREAADLQLLVIDATDPGPDGADGVAGVGSVAADAPRVVAWNKCDREEAEKAPDGAVAVSARERAGLAALARAAARALGLGDARDDAGAAPLGLVRELSARHRRALGKSHAELARAIAMLSCEAPLDLAADSLRAATDALDDIRGRTTPEDLLDRIFARFCLGK